MNMKIMTKILLEHNLDGASNWRGQDCLFDFSSRNNFLLTCQRTVCLCIGEGVSPATSTGTMPLPLMYGSQCPLISLCQLKVNIVRETPETGQSK